MSEDGVSVICPRCLHEWVRKSKVRMVLVTCPSCGKKIKLVKLDVSISNQRAEYDKYVIRCKLEPEEEASIMTYDDWIEANGEYIK